MFVYLLPHSREPRFKIGKANDIHQRIYSLGGYEAFDLENGRCVAFDTERQAYRIERVLHRLFRKWNIEVKAGIGRYDGDTEQFAMECFGRALQFLTENSDITQGTTPQVLPPRPPIPPLPPNRISREERLVKAQERAFNEFSLAMDEIEDGIDRLMELKLENLCIYADAPPDEIGFQTHYLMASGERPALDEAFTIISHWRTLTFSLAACPNEFGSFIGSMAMRGDEERGVIEAALFPFTPQHVVCVRRGSRNTEVWTPRNHPRVIAAINRFKLSDDPRQRTTIGLSRLGIAWD